MWDEVFEPSMLDDQDILIIHCPTEELAEELFPILKDHGIKWGSGESLNPDATRPDGKQMMGGRAIACTAGELNLGQGISIPAASMTIMTTQSVRSSGEETFDPTPVASDSEILSLLM